MPRKKLQPPMTVEEQIANLKALGLTIEDEVEAKRFLNDVSYFRVIKAYSLGLKPRNGSYHQGVTFSQIVDLYMFNANFRQMLFPVIEQIEVNLRCRVANYVSCKFGVLGYENSEHFANEKYHSNFLEDMKNEVNRNAKSPFVRNFQNCYQDGKIPMYALVELFSFGTLSKFYKNMKNPDKKAIAATYGVGYTYLESWIESIAYVRNLCAHYGRLYNATLPKRPKVYKQYEEISMDHARIFAVLLCIAYLVPQDKHWVQFVDGLEALTSKYPSVKIETMGFPNEWKNLLLRI